MEGKIPKKEEAATMNTRLAREKKNVPISRPDRIRSRPGVKARRLTVLVTGFCIRCADKLIGRQRNHFGSSAQGLWIS